jgi:hypothetical protein
MTSKWFFPDLKREDWTREFREDLERQKGRLKIEKESDGLYYCSRKDRLAESGEYAYWEIDKKMGRAVEVESFELPAGLFEL